MFRVGVEIILVLDWNQVGIEWRSRMRVLGRGAMTAASVLTPKLCNTK